MTTTIAIAMLLFGGAMILFFLFTSWRHRVDAAELGTMSQQWRIEQRAHDRHDSLR